MYRVLLLIALVVALDVPQPVSAAGNAALAVGAVAPALNEPTPKGPFDSTKSVKPYVLELFAVWCPHCQREVSIVNQLQKIDGDRADVIAVPADPFGFDRSSLLQQADIEHFTRRFGVRYRIGFDGFFSAAYDYGLASFPTFYVVDSARRITAVETGEISFDRLHADVAAALQR